MFIGILMSTQVAALNKLVDKYNMCAPYSASPGFRFDIDKEAKEALEQGEGNRDFFGKEIYLS